MTPGADNNFWQVNIGNVLTIVTTLIALSAFHISNVNRIKKAAKEWQDMNTKLGIIWIWFEGNIINRTEHYQQPKSVGEETES